MANRAGQVLSDEEVREFNAYGNQGLTLPDKFAGVVAENINGSRVYRFPSAEELKAGEAASKAAADAAAEAEKLAEKVRAEAAKRATPAVPPPPAPPAAAS